MRFESDEILDVVTARLPAAGIDCIMIGGHAVNHYGVLRATQDIDFMIAAADEDAVRRIMSEAGFSNVASHETVIFFQCPGSPMRVDFLKVDGQTMSRLLQSAVETSYFEGRSVRVPSLRDLIAMKVFAMGAGRQRDVLCEDNRQKKSKGGF